MKETMNTIDEAKQILKKYHDHYFLSEIEIKPELSAEGKITNLEAFNKLKYKNNYASHSKQPVQQMMYVAPKAVYVTLEAIDEMKATVEEKNLLFDSYIMETKAIEEADAKQLDSAYLAFMEVFDAEALEGPKFCS